MPSDSDPTAQFRSASPSYKLKHSPTSPARLRYGVLLRDIPARSLHDELEFVRAK